MGNVVGAYTSEGFIAIPEPFPRSEMATRARALAQAYGITIPEGLLAVLAPAPEGASSK